MQKSKSVKWRRDLVNVSVCLLTSRPIPERHFHFRAVGRGYGMYEDKMAQGYFKIKAIFWVDIPILHFDSLCREY